MAIRDDSIQALSFLRVLEDFKVIHVSRNGYNGLCGARVIAVLMDSVHAVNTSAMLKLFLDFWLL